MRAIGRMFQSGPPRWRVAVLESDGAARAGLRAAVEDAGGTVAVEAPLRLDAVELMREMRPDVLIVAPSLWGREPALMPRITAVVDCPAVLHTRDTSASVVKQANRAGIMAFLLKPLRPAELAPTLDLALARFRDLRRLQRARSERPIVDRAKGKLMSDRHLSEEEAFQWLRRRAMDSRQRIGDVARAVLSDPRAVEVLPQGAR
ncbi:MAG TPA: ANTAR domain-containing protein [Candidatus Nitrosotalea sp.]|nr:ANTAR domain-containing protein [Candidatus Nitrosotalea sp.]